MSAHHRVKSPLTISEMRTAVGAPLLALIRRLVGCIVLVFFLFRVS
jgi:hypothetical protein